MLFFFRFFSKAKQETLLLKGSGLFFGVFIFIIVGCSRKDSNIVFPSDPSVSELKTGQSLGDKNAEQSLNSISKEGSNIKVVTLNVLAPCWASPTEYPAACQPKLDRVFRRDKIIGFLTQVMNAGAGIIALQEVQIDEYPYFYNAVKSLYEGSLSLHDDNYWSSYITIDPPFARNGNALFLRKELFQNITFLDKPLTNDGNHCVYATAQIKATGSNVRLASVHLDTDNANRDNELSAIFNFLPNQLQYTDIIAGDFNASASSGSLSNLIKQNSFLNALDVEGIEEQTHPFTVSYNRNTIWGPIDHVLFRNASVTGKATTANDGMPTVDNGVIDFSVWKQYPSGATYEAQRINKNFDNCGADHFPVIATLSIK